MNYYKRHLGDYIKDTAHLSLLEHGVYTRLMDIYYGNEQALPSVEKCCRLLGARSDEEKEAVSTILAEFFVQDGEHWSNARCEAEIAAYQKKAEANREIGKLGGRRKKEATQTNRETEPIGNPEKTQTVSERNPGRTLANSHKPIDTPRKRAAPKPPIPEDFGISDRVRRWAAEKGHGNLDAHLAKFVGYCKAHAKTYADYDEAFMTCIRENWAKVPTAKGPEVMATGERMAAL